MIASARRVTGLAFAVLLILAAYQGYRAQANPFQPRARIRETQGRSRAIGRIAGWLREFRKSRSVAVPAPG